jgi:Hemerythrin HHE cation binding domain/Molydopterin dinucleotide binding domain
MKRDEALRDLSRDHHQALHRAMRMKRASESDLDEVRADVLEFWRNQGARHFRIEEEVLLPAFAAHGHPADEAVVRVLVDHVWISARMDRLAADALDVADVRELGQRLDEHVRHEEQVLFPTIENWHFHTRTKTGRAPELRAAAPDVWVELSREDAERLGIAEGEMVAIESRAAVWRRRLGSGRRGRASSSCRFTTAIGTPARPTNDRAPPTRSPSRTGIRRPSSRSTRSTAAESGS